MVSGHLGNLKDSHESGKFLILTGRDYLTIILEESRQYDFLKDDASGLYLCTAYSNRKTDESWQSSAVKRYLMELSALEAHQFMVNDAENTTTPMYKRIGGVKLM